MKKLQFSVASHAIAALNHLKDRGFEAYIVGGAVRDLLRGMPPDDYDIATNARPAEVKEIFSKCIPTGEKHGTVTAIVEGHPIEITTYRTDGAYLDARHPASVQFAASIRDDLSRRDFTINAMACNGDTLLDFFGGQGDLKLGRIQTVGDPNTRFSEDALRILRAFRFASVLNFELTSPTLQAAIAKAPLLQKISRERIYAELTKALCGVRPQALQPLLECGGLHFLQIHTGNLQPLAETPKLPEMRYAAFCRLCRSVPDQLLTALRAPKKMIARTLTIHQLLCNTLSADKALLKQQFAPLPQTLWFDILCTYGALTGQSTAAIQQCLHEIVCNNEPYTIEMLKINGHDLAALGVSGRAVGDLLRQLLAVAIKNPDTNQKERLIQLAKKQIGS